MFSSFSQAFVPTITMTVYSKTPCIVKLRFLDQIISEIIYAIFRLMDESTILQYIALYLHS